MRLRRLIEVRPVVQAQSIRGEILEHAALGTVETCRLEHVHLRLASKLNRAAKQSSNAAGVVVEGLQVGDLEPAKTILRPVRARKDHPAGKTAVLLRGQDPVLGCAESPSERS